MKKLKEKSIGCLLLSHQIFPSLFPKQYNLLITSSPSHCPTFTTTHTHTNTLTTTLISTAFISPNLSFSHPLQAEQYQVLFPYAYQHSWDGIDFIKGLLNMDFKKVGGMSRWLPLHFPPSSSIFILSKEEVTKQTRLETAFSLNSVDPEHSPKSGKHLCVCVLYDGWLNENPALPMGGQCSECHYILFIETEENIHYMDFSGGASGNVGDMRDVAVVPVLRRSPGGGHGNPLQYSCLENPMDGGAWQATVHRVTKSWTWPMT